MSKFTSFVSIMPDLKHNMWITTNELVWYTNEEMEEWKAGSSPYIEVECGFMTDGCSIPVCILWQKITPRTLPSCILHDDMWWKQLGFWWSNWQFLKSLKATKNPLITRWKLYLGVTLFGYYIYYNKKPNETKRKT